MSSVEIRASAQGTGGNGTQEPAPKKVRFGDTRTAKILIFVASLLGAFLLWIYAMGYDSETVTETFTGIPVELTGTNVNGYTLAESGFSLSIDITASGTRAAMDGVSSSNFKAYVDITNVAVSGYSTLPIQVVEPGALNVDSQSTRNVTLYFAKFTTKRVPVVVEQTYLSAYTVGEVTQSVQSVSVYGPENLLMNAEGYAFLDLGSVTTTEVSGSGTISLRESGSKAAISSPYITLETQTVEVSYVMYATKTVPLRLALTGGLLNAADVQYAFSADSVSLYGPAAALNSITSLPVSVDETGIDSSESYEFTVADLLTAAGADSRVVPSEADAYVGLTVNVPSTRTMKVTVPASRITVVNMPTHVSVSVASTLTVNILGSPEAVKGYDTGKLTATVDYYSLEMQPSSGVYIGTATVETGDSSVCVYGGPYTVSVTVTGT